MLVLDLSGYNNLPFMLKCWNICILKEGFCDISSNKNFKTFIFNFKSLIENNLLLNHEQHSSKLSKSKENRCLPASSGICLNDVISVDVGTVVEATTFRADPTSSRY